MEELDEIKVRSFLENYELDGESSASKKFTNGEFGIYVEENEIKIFFHSSPGVLDVHLTLTPDKDGKLLVFTHWREGNTYNSIEDFLEVLTVFKSLIPNLTLAHLERGNAQLKMLKAKEEKITKERADKIEKAKKDFRAKYYSEPLRGEAWLKHYSKKCTGDSLEVVLAGLSAISLRPVFHTVTFKNGEQGLSYFLDNKEFSFNQLSKRLDKELFLKGESLE